MATQTRRVSVMVTSGELLRQIAVVRLDGRRELLHCRRLRQHRNTLTDPVAHLTRPGQQHVA